VLNSKWKIAGIAGAALAALGASAFQADSEGAPGLRIPHAAPLGYFDYTANPGQTISDTITVVNPSSANATYAVYAADAYTEVNSGIGYANRGDSMTAVGTWISLSAGSVSLAGNSTIQVNFTVHVPQSASAGDHVGAIAAENPTPNPGASGHFTINTIERSVIAVVVHVPGSTEAGFDLSQPNLVVQNGTRQVLNVVMNNSGNIIIKPQLSGSITACGQSVTLVPLSRTLDSFLPQSSIVYPFYIDNQVLPAGCYHLSLSAGISGRQLGNLDQQFNITAQQANIPSPTPSGATKAPPVQPVRRALPDWVLPAAAGVGGLLVLNLLGMAILLARRTRRN
jgi:hypothetical protein